MSGVFLRLRPPKRNDVFVSLCLEPNWPLFLKVNPPIQGPFQSKPRIIWVLGYTWCIYSTSEKIHISSMRSLGFFIARSWCKSWWRDHIVVTSFGPSRMIIYTWGGKCTKPFWGVGGWDFLENCSYTNSVFLLCNIFRWNGSTPPNTSMNSICIPTIYPQITN